MLTETQIRDTEAILIQVPTTVLKVLDIIAPDEKPMNGAKRIENYIVRELIELAEANEPKTEEWELRAEDGSAH